MFAKKLRKTYYTVNTVHVLVHCYRRPRKKELPSLRQAHNKQLFNNSLLLVIPYAHILMSARRPRKKELTALRQAHNKSLFKNSFLLETFCAFAVIGTYVRKEAKEERAAGLAKRVGGHEVDGLCRGPSRGNDHVPGHEATLKLFPETGKVL